MKDLLRSSARGPLVLRRRIDGLRGREALPGYAEQVAQTVEGMLAASLDGKAILCGFDADVPPGTKVK